MTKQRLRLVRSTTENRTVTLRRPKNGALRTREHLTIDEVERLIEAAKNNRYGHRDALMLLLTFRHGLRAGEICDLRWDQVDFKTAGLHVRRLKNGMPSTHPLTGRELRALRRHQRENSSGHQSPRAYAAPCLRVQAGERRPRHTVTASLSRTPQHPEHDAVHSAGTGSVQELLEGLAERINVPPSEDRKG
jgi:integrase